MVWTRNRARALAIGGAVGVWLALAAFSLHDVRGRARAEARVRGAALARLAQSASVVLRERDARIASELGRLRLALRSGDVWIEGVDPSASEDGAAGRENAERRLRSILRGGLEELGVARAFEIVVAGESGLVHTRLHRTGSAAREVSAASKDASLAKALWYAEDVRRAVSAAGRRVERGDVDFAGDRDAATLRFSIGLHDSDEVVQGVLVASIDLARAIGAVEDLAGSEQTLRLVSSLGRVLGKDDPGGLVEAPEARWALEALGSGRASEPFESDGRIVVVSPLTSENGADGSIVVVAGMEAPARGLRAWARSVWPVALLGSLCVGGLGLGLSGRTPERARDGSGVVEASAAFSPARSEAMPEDAGSEALRGAGHAPPGVHEDADDEEPWAPDRRADADPGAHSEGAVHAETFAWTDASESAGDIAGTDASEGAEGFAGIDGEQPRGVAGPDAAAAEPVPGAEPEVGAEPGPVESRVEPVEPETFVLRDWLADVRSCLEREAARRGLGLDVRCARTLPAEVESDPAWLGGLVLAWGREALDATANDQVVLDVVANESGGFRFRLDAGDESLAPVAGMEATAARLGARFERGDDGRHALVVTRSDH